MPHASEFPHGDIPAFTQALDITAPLGLAPVFPGDEQYRLEWKERIEEGADFSTSFLTLSSHAGTHLDAPSHIIASGKTVNTYALQRFILPARVVLAEEDERGCILASSLAGSSLNPGEAVLFKTRNSSCRLMHSPLFSEVYAFLSPEAACLCAAMGASLVGIDYLSVDLYGDNSAPVHRYLLEKDILILEGIDLESVDPGGYYLLCLPLKAEGSEAAPVRAVLLR